MNGSRAVETRSGVRCCWAAVTVAVALLATGAASAAVSPSQVLVLYNGDWTEDLPGSDPGQDSEEVARYYVRMHADPVTGEKPQLLGLRCIHGQGHLNRAQIPEESRDNASGVVGEGLGKGESTLWLQDSRRVEVFLDDPKATLDWGSVEMKVRPLDKRDGARWAIRKGVPVEDPALRVEKKDSRWEIRLNALAWFTGRVEVSFRVADKNGREAKSGTQVFHDVLKVRPSRTGPDGVRDDLRYTQDVDLQVRKFLEDPSNRRPDGTLLKDHVLFLVLCYGLPRATVFHYGISRGATENPDDHSPNADLGQRLALLYYDVESVMELRTGPMKFGGGQGFTRYVFRTGFARPMMGSRVNPFLHPWAFAREKKGAKPAGVPFTPETRAAAGPSRFLYLATRVDGESPNMAKALVDNAVYASRHLTPRMGGRNGAGTKDRAESRRDLAGAEDLSGKRGGLRPKVGYLEPGHGFWGDLPTYLPGATDRHVISNNVAAALEAGVNRMLRQNVTFTGGGAVWGGPHITNVSWWDDDVLWPLLLQGQCLGEALQQNMAYQGWITSFYGDPLFAPDQSAATADRDPPLLKGGAEGVTVRLGAGGSSSMAEVRCEVQSTQQRPEVAQIRVTCTPANGGTARVQEEAPFVARPVAVVRGLQPETRYRVKVELQDPYGNHSEWAAPDLTTGPSPRNGAEVVDLAQNPRTSSLLLHDSAAGQVPSLRSGQIDMELSAPGGDRVELLKGKQLAFEVRRDEWLFRVGGSWAIGRQRVERGAACKVRLLWSEEPVLREVYWKEGDTYRRIAAENRVAWRTAGEPERLGFSNGGEIEWKKIELRAAPE